MAVRRFVTVLRPFELSPTDRDRLVRALVGEGDVPDLVIEEIKDLLKRARVDTALSMDARRSTTPEGRAEIEAVADLASRLSAAINFASDEVRHFLDFELPYSAGDDALKLKLGTRAAADRHLRRDEQERPSASDGPPRKWVAFELALALASIWDEHSGRGWSHRGPWGGFVDIAFELAGVEASAERMARNAARAFRDTET